MSFELNIFKNYLIIAILLLSICHAKQTVINESNGQKEVNYFDLEAEYGDSIPEFNIDLDEKNLDIRYREISAHFCPVMKKAIPGVISELQQLFGGYSIVVWVARAYFSMHYYIFMRSSDLRDEVTYWSKACDTPVGMTTLFNYFYDIVSAVADHTMCSTIIFYDKDNNLVMGSNLDFWFHRFLHQLHFKQNVYRNKELIYSSLNIAGVTGALRFYSHKGKFAISMNQRLTGGTLGFFAQLLYKNWQTVNQFLQTTAENATSLDEVTKLIRNTPLLSQAYFIVMGRDSENNLQGGVFETDRTSIYDEYWLDINSEDQWFIVTTNWDRDKPENPTDIRRQPLIEKIDALGRENMSMQKMWMLLLEKPTFVRDPDHGTTASLVYKISGKKYFESKDMKFSTESQAPKNNKNKSSEGDL